MARPASAAAQPGRRPGRRGAAALVQAGHCGRPPGLSTNRRAACRRVRTVPGHAPGTARGLGPVSGASQAGERDRLRDAVVRPRHRRDEPDPPAEEAWRAPCRPGYQSPLAVHAAVGRAQGQLDEPRLAAAVQHLASQPAAVGPFPCGSGGRADDLAHDAVLVARQQREGDARGSTPAAAHRGSARPGPGLDREADREGAAAWATDRAVASASSSPGACASTDALGSGACRAMARALAAGDAHQHVGKLADRRPDGIHVRRHGRGVVEPHDEDVVRRPLGPIARRMPKSASSRTRLALDPQGER